MLCPNHSYRFSLSNNLLNSAIRDYLVEVLLVIYDLKQSIVMRLESFVCNSMSQNELYKCF